MRVFGALFTLCFALTAHAEEITLLNASYDPTRELYADYNRLFATEWKEKTGDEVRVRMSHAGSGAQARAVGEGLPADVVTLALGADIDAIASKGRIATDWEKRLPHHSSPYRSVIVFLVRKGNPKQIRDWDDLARDGVSILTPNPKTSGGARWNYLAALAYGEKQYDDAAQRSYMQRWLKNVLLFDTGARAATTNFVRRGQGDVLITWENEAYVAQHYFGKDAFEIVMPSVTILAEPTIAVVDKTVDTRNTRYLAEAYLNGLYTPEAQAIIVKHHYRPLDDKTKSDLPSLKGVFVTDIRAFGGWKSAQQKHFAEGGVFDQLTSGARE
jgi:sulfate/thiosulfate-binding protein